MKYKLLLLTAILGFINVNGYTQNIPTTIKKFAQSIGQQSESNFSNRIALCDPDSIHGYIYEPTIDSVLVFRQIYKRDGIESTTIYTYTGIPQMLEAKDSTVFDLMGRPIFNELWEFNEDSMFIVLSERSYSFPHDGNVISEVPDFISTIGKILDPTFKDFVAFDSLILYSRDFFTGNLIVEEKTVNIFSPEGRIIENQIYNWDAFGTMDWYLYSKSLYFYDANGRLDRTEDYIWNGIDLTLRTSEDYTYNAQDSLTTVLTTNEESGLPEEKLDITYDIVEGTIILTSSGWDPDAMEWISFFSILLDYDDLGRVEVLELFFDFLGSQSGTRVEYIYLMDEPCPDHANIYNLDELGEWVLEIKYYFDPVTISSTDLSEAVQYSVYPNPASGGIWIDVPAGLNMQLTSLQGEILYQGRSKGGKEYLDIPLSRRMVLLTFGEGAQAFSRLILNQN